MKVLHVFKTYLPDDFRGIERVIYAIAESTWAQGVRSEVLAVSPSPVRTPITVANHIVHQSKRNAEFASTALSISVFAKYRQLARSADVVHFHYPWPLMDLLHLTTRASAASVVTYHSDIVKQGKIEPFYAPLRDAFLSRVDCIVATSPNYIASSPVLGRFAGKTCVVPIGLEPSVTSPPPTLLDRWRRDVGSRFFLFIGAPRYYKGLQFLMTAAEATGFPVVLAGCTKEQLGVAGLSCPSNVRVVGEVSDADKEALLYLCRALVLPSHLRSEAFGVVLLEASRAGRPMISCELSTGTSYVNIDGETGLIVPPADPASLAAAMRCLEQDDRLAESMGHAAKARFHSMFEQERMGKDYASIYREIITARIST